MSNYNALPFDDACRAARINLRLAAADVKALNDHPEFFTRRAASHNEQHANIMLAYRHMEDACMRLGKAIQAFEGGQSVYELDENKLRQTIRDCACRVPITTDAAGKDPSDPDFSKLTTNKNGTIINS